MILWLFYTSNNLFHLEVFLRLDRISKMEWSSFFENFTGLIQTFLGEFLQGCLWEFFQKCRHSFFSIFELNKLRCSPILRSKTIYVLLLRRFNPSSSEILLRIILAIQWFLRFLFRNVFKHFFQIHPSYKDLIFYNFMQFWLFDFRYLIGDFLFYYRRSTMTDW